MSRFYRVCKTVGRWNTIIRIRIVVTRDSFRLFCRINRLVSDANRALDFNSNRFLPRWWITVRASRQIRLCCCTSSRFSIFIRILLLALHFAHSRAFPTFTSVIRCKLDVVLTIKDERGNWPAQGHAQGFRSSCSPCCLFALVEGPWSKCTRKMHSWNAFYIWVCSLNLFMFVKVARGLCAGRYFILAIILSIAILFITFYKRSV